MKLFASTRRSNSKKNKPTKKFSSIKTPVAVAAGVLGPCVAANTGASVALHEVVGHGLLGLTLTHNYASGDGPRYWVGGFDAFHRMENAHSVGGGLNGFFSWIFATHDRNGVNGTTSQGDGELNALGRAMGSSGNDAWVSITGSIPGLLLNTLFVSVGMSIRHKYPNIALALIIFGMENSVIEGTYAWTAAVMTPSQLRENAQNGHDFANFAIRMHEVTGLNSSLIAISTALFWTGFIPLVALGIYFYQKSKRLDIVPDEMAAYYFAKYKTKNAIEEEQLLNFMSQYLGNTEDIITDEKKAELCDSKPFIEYLVEKIPKKTLKNSKYEILKKWQNLQKPSKLQSSLAYAIVVLLLLGMVTQILNVLANTIQPALLPIAHVLNFILPIFGLLSVISSGYETYNDLKCNNIQVPVLAKFISVFKLIITSTIVSLVIAATFAGSMNYILIPAIIAGTLLSLGLSFAKINIIQNSFKKTVNIDDKQMQDAIDNIDIKEEDNLSINLQLV